MKYIHEVKELWRRAKARDPGQLPSLASTSREGKMGEGVAGVAGRTARAGSRARQSSVRPKADGARLLRLRRQADLSAAQDAGLEPSSLLAALALYRAFAVLDRNMSGEIAHVGLSPTQFNILMSLRRLRRPLTMGELASLLVVRPTNLSGIVNSLCRRGLVRREINASDQRSLVTMVTPAGERLLAGFVPGHWAHLAHIMAEFDEESREALTVLLRRLVSSIENAEAADPNGRRGHAAEPRKGRARAGKPPRMASRRTVSQN